MKTQLLGIGVGFGMILGLGAGWASADEAKTPITASMVLTIVSRPAELSGRALDRALLEPGPPPAVPNGGELQPDGSVKYGNLSVTVRNPCPPGIHYEPLPLPGRRAR
jgi:hypothetical protein